MYALNLYMWLSGRLRAADDSGAQCWGEQKWKGTCVCRFNVLYPIIFKCIARERRNAISTQNPRNILNSNTCNLSSAKRLHLDPILPDAQIDQLLLHRAHEAFWPAHEVLGLRVLQEQIFCTI